jgi:predicted ATP-binding protein involved in virulence
MQKPLNAKEHNQAFLTFLIFLIVTVAMVAGALFINFRVPAKELTILRERSDNFRNQSIGQESFKRSLNEFMAIMNRSDSSSKAMIESEAKPKLDALRNATNIDDSASSVKLKMTVLTLANQYMNAKLKLADLNDYASEIARLKNKVSELSRDLDDCRTRANFNNGNNQ